MSIKESSVSRSLSELGAGVVGVRKIASYTIPPEIIAERKLAGTCIYCDNTLSMDVNVIYTDDPDEIPRKRKIFCVCTD